VLFLVQKNKVVSHGITYKVLNTWSMSFSCFENSNKTMIALIRGRHTNSPTLHRFFSLRQALGENNFSRVDKSECLPLIWAIIVYYQATTSIIWTHSMCSYSDVPLTNVLWTCYRLYVLVAMNVSSHLAYQATTSMRLRSEKFINAKQINYSIIIVNKS
jgi:hypothetical protein